MRRTQKAVLSNTRKSQSLPKPFLTSTPRKKFNTENFFEVKILSKIKKAVVKSALLKWVCPWFNHTYWVPSLHLVPNSRWSHSTNSGSDSKFLLPSPKSSALLSILYSQMLYLKITLEISFKWNKLMNIECLQALSVRTERV